MQGLSALNAEKANDALRSAISHVERSSGAAAAAITSLGGGLKARADDLKAGGGTLRERLADLKAAGAAEVADNVEEFLSLAGAAGATVAAATADASSVAGTAGELFKRGVQGAFGVYTTKEGMAKAQVDAMVASRVERLTGIIAAASRSLESIQAGKGPLVVGGVDFKQDKLEAFSSALERVAAAVQRAPTKSQLALRGFQAGQDLAASTSSALLSSISKFHALMGSVFPGVKAAGRR
ncbi:MAG: hypothetical protein J3K34DRAFT_434607 [Monoraphidium minutum]|nr:MAG: hypothetical protein J3K34DRAFT_434607 [Monoraphidium minutum]